MVYKDYEKLHPSIESPSIRQSPGSHQIITKILPG